MDYETWRLILLPIGICLLWAFAALIKRLIGNNTPDGPVKRFLFLDR